MRVSPMSRAKYLPVNQVKQMSAIIAVHVSKDKAARILKARRRTG
jgi:hypothetical protein